MDSNAVGAALSRQLGFGGFTHYEANDSSGCTFTASANSITMVNNKYATSSGDTSGTSDVDWFRVGFRIGDTISVGSTANNGTDALPTTHTIRDISDTAGGSVLYDVIAVDSIGSNETVAAKIFKSDKYLSPLSIAIFDGGGTGEVTSITMYAYDDSSFYGTSSTSSVEIITVEPNTLDLDRLDGIVINNYSLARSGGTSSQMPLGARRYPVGNTRVSIGMPQLTMNLRMVTQEGYRTIYNLIEGDTYDYVFFDTDQVASSTAYRQLKLQMLSGSIKQSPDLAGQYIADLTFSVLGEEVE